MHPRPPSFELYMIMCHMLFSDSSCAVWVKMESGYIYSVFMWGRHSGLVECLSYWHTCCVPSGSTDTQWQWLGGTLCGTFICLYALGCYFCYLLTFQCRWFSFMIPLGDWSCCAVGITEVTPIQQHYSPALYVFFFFALDGRIQLRFPGYCAACFASNGS